MCLQQVVVILSSPCETRTLWNRLELYSHPNVPAGLCEDATSALEREVPCSK